MHVVDQAGREGRRIVGHVRSAARGVGLHVVVSARQLLPGASSVSPRFMRPNRIGASLRSALIVGGMKMIIASRVACCALIALCCGGCGASHPPLAGGACAPGALVCGGLVAGESGVPVLHCLTGDAVYVQQMICTATCASVANDNTQIQCNGGADWAVINSPCVTEGATACNANGADGSNSTTVLTCENGHWGDTLDCPNGEHCEDTSTTAGVITIGCQ